MSSIEFLRSTGLANGNSRSLARRADRKMGGTMERQDLSKYYPWMLRAAPVVAVVLAVVVVC